jgi:integrase
MANEKIDVTDLDLVITKIEKRTSSGGAWVRGKINNAVRFEALVFAEHAESRYGGLRTPSETLSLRWEDIDWEMNRMSIPEPKVEHHEGRGIRSCPIFPELRSILDEAFEIFGDKSEYVVAAPQYRAAANTAMGWKNSNLRTEMTRLLRRAGVSGWPRLFHSMRASRQTELQREFPLHVVCSWLGNSPRIAQQSYLLVTEDDFAKAAGVQKMMVEG